MTLRKSATRPKERWTLLAVMALGLLLLGGAITLAVNATGAFELDGNAVSANDTPATDDWDRVCHQVTAGGFDSAGHATGAQCATASNTTGATAVSWVDARNSLEIYTGGGSKDFNNPGSDWLWKPKDTVPDKDTISHSFAARYSLTPDAANCPSTGATCEVIFFGSDRYDNAGDAQLGFWFFQNKVETTNTSSQGGFKFSGDHKIGDLLVISDFSNGGTTANIKVYSWNPTACPKADSGNENSVPVGGCPAKNLKLEGKSTAASCDTSAGTAAFCGIVNPTNGTTSPWPFLDKTGHTNFEQGELYEAGINLSGLGFGSECFASVLAESRSSDSTSAVLKDFVLSNFGECTSHTVTTPQTVAAGPAYSDISSDLSIGTSARVDVADKAVISVTGLGGSFDGSVKFYLCGPLALTTTTNCSTGGVQIGAPAAGETVTGSGGTATVYSDTVTLTSAGRYCWRAEYSGDSSVGVPASKDPAKSVADGGTVSECFKVQPKTPTLSTTAVDSSGVAIGSTPVDFGQPIYDKASLTGTAKEPGTDGLTGSTSIGATAGSQSDAGGTIVFKLYGPSASTSPSTAECTTLAKDKDGISFPSAGISVSISGDGTYPSANPSTVTFTPGAPGYYFWKAAYGGDLPNTTAAPLDGSGTPTQHNADCSVAAERVQVRTIPTSISTAQKVFPQDSATMVSSVSGDSLPSGGTVIFRLYTSLVNCQAHGDSVGSGGLIYKETKTTAGGLTETLTTGNTTVSVSADGTYYWYVTYAPGDTAHTGRQSDCTENTVLTFNNDSGPGTLFPTPIP